MTKSCFCMVIRPSFVQRGWRPFTVEGEDLSDMRPKGLVRLQAPEGRKRLVVLELFGPDFGWAGEVTALGELWDVRSRLPPLVPGISLAPGQSSTASLANWKPGTAPMRYLSLDYVPRILAFSGWGNWERPQPDSARCGQPVRRISDAGNEQPKLIVFLS